MCRVLASSNQTAPGRIDSRMRGLRRRTNGTLASAVSFRPGAMKSFAM
jgi:hypothetical protein